MKIHEDIPKVNNVTNSNITMPVHWNKDLEKETKYKAKNDENRHQFVKPQFPSTFSCKDISQMCTKENLPKIQTPDINSIPNGDSHEVCIEITHDYEAASLANRYIHT